MGWKLKTKYWTVIPWIAMLFEIYFQKILKWCGKTLIWNCSCCQSLIYISMHWIVNYHFHSCLCWFCFQPSIYIFRACCGNLANISFVKFTSSKKHPDKSEFLYFLFIWKSVSTARLNSNLGEFHQTKRSFLLWRRFLLYCPHKSQWGHPRWQTKIQNGKLGSECQVKQRLRKG